MDLTTKHLSNLKEAGKILNATVASGHNPNSSYLVFPNGLKLFFYMPWNSKKGKVQVSCVQWPEMDGKQVRPQETPFLSYNESSPSMNLSLEKAPHLIAKDIDRRILGDYSTLYHNIKEWASEKDSQYAEHDKRVSKLSSLIGARKATDINRAYDRYGSMLANIGDRRMTAKVSCTKGIDITIDDISEDQLKKILEVLKNG